MTFTPNQTAFHAAAEQIIDAAAQGNADRAFALHIARHMLMNRTATADQLQAAIDTLTHHGDWIDHMRAEMLSAALRRRTGAADA